MTQNEIYTLFASVAAIIISVGSIISNNINFEKVKKYQFADIEASIANRIANARYQMQLLSLEMIKLKLSLPKDAKLPEEYCNILNSLNNSVKEDDLNAFDEMCQTYLDHKCDRARIKKRYFNSIRDLFGAVSPYKEKLTENNNASYSAIHKVFKEWHNSEK